MTTGDGASAQDRALQEYLDELGIGDYMPIFGKHGVTSLPLLKLLGGPTGAAVRAAVQADVTAGVAPVAGSPLAAQVVETITPATVQAWLDRHPVTGGGAGAGQPAETDPSVKARQERIAEALNQVRDLRQQAGKLVGDTDAEQRKQIAAQLDGLRQRLAGEGLGDVVTADDTVAELQRSLDDLQSGLSKVNEALWAAVSTSDLSLNELISRHRLLHGHTVEALRLRSSGSPVLAMPELASENRSPDAVDDVQYDYSSQSARTVAERVIETASASLATSAEVSGAGFAGAGVAAMSVAMSYNQANASDTDRFGRTGATQATHIRTHYHRSPQRQIDVNARHLRFSDDAAGELAAIAVADPGVQPERAERFLRAFGSHVFTTVTLGGWYKHTATAEAQTLVQDTQLSDAVATAMDAAVSASASYSGLASAVSGSAGAATTHAATSADSRRQNYTINNLTVSVTVKNNGGMEGLPLDYWISSVQYAPQWAVIDRDDPQPIWDVVEHAAAQLSRQLGLEPAAVTALARLLEQVWVTRVFLPSLDTADVALRRIVAAAAPTTARELADVLGAAVDAMHGRIAITTSSPSFEPVRTACAGGQSSDFDGTWTVPVRSLRVRWDDDKLTGLVWDHFDGHHSQMANADGPNQHDADFTFQPDETLTAFTVYVVEYGGVPGGVPCGLQLTTSTGRTFGPTRAAGTPIHFDTQVTGRCLMGFHGGQVLGGNPFVPGLGLCLSPPIQPWAPPATLPPTITAAGRRVPPPPETPNGPPGACGFHLVITDGRHPGEPAAVLLNRYLTLPDAPPWTRRGQLDKLYTQLDQTLSDASLNRDHNLLVLTSFGMSTHLAPPLTLAALLQTIGAGQALGQWQAAATPPGPAPDWVPTVPCNYILIGYFGTDPDQAAETFQTSPATAFTAQLTGPPEVRLPAPSALNPNAPTP